MFGPQRDDRLVGRRLVPALGPFVVGELDHDHGARTGPFEHLVVPAVDDEVSVVGGQGGVDPFEVLDNLGHRLDVLDDPDRVRGHDHRHIVVMNCSGQSAGGGALITGGTSGG